LDLKKHCRVVKHKLKKLPNSTNISNARALRYKNGSCCNLTLPKMATAIPCSQFPKEIQIL